MSRVQGVNLTVSNDKTLCYAYISVNVNFVQGAYQTAERLIVGS